MMSKETGGRMRGEEEEWGKGGKGGERKEEGRERRAAKIGRRGEKRMIECSIMLATYVHHISFFPFLPKPSSPLLHLLLPHTYLVGSWDMAGPG